MCSAPSDTEENRFVWELWSRVLLNPTPNSPPLHMFGWDTKGRLTGWQNCFLLSHLSPFGRLKTLKRWRTPLDAMNLMQGWIMCKKTPIQIHKTIRGKNWFCYEELWQQSIILLMMLKFNLQKPATTLNCLGVSKKKINTAWYGDILHADPVSIQKHQISMSFYIIS